MKEAPGETCHEMNDKHQFPENIDPMNYCNRQRDNHMPLPRTMTNFSALTGVGEYISHDLYRQELPERWVISQTGCIHLQPSNCRLDDVTCVIQ